MSWIRLCLCWDCRKLDGSLRILPERRGTLILFTHYIGIIIVRFYFSGAEVLFAAEQQLEAAGGVADTPFVTVKVTLDEKNQSQVEAFQLSKQCMEMVAEGVLAPSVNLGLCDVNNTFTAIVEGKPSKTVRMP